MKKRCTNSACRRVFDTRKMRNGGCPYCGKPYPRIEGIYTSDRKMKKLLSRIYRRSLR